MSLLRVCVRKAKWIHKREPNIGAAFSSNRLCCTAPIAFGSEEKWRIRGDLNSLVGSHQSDNTSSSSRCDSGATVGFDACHCVWGRVRRELVLFGLHWRLSSYNFVLFGFNYIVNYSGYLIILCYKHFVFIELKILFQWKKPLLLKNNWSNKIIFFINTVLSWNTSQIEMNIIFCIIKDASKEKIIMGPSGSYLLYSRKPHVWWWVTFTWHIWCSKGWTCESHCTRTT